MQSTPMTFETMSLATALRHAPPGLLPHLAALSLGEVPVFLAPQTDAPIPSLRYETAVGRPLVAVIADVGPGGSTGPDGFDRRSLRRLARRFDRIAILAGKACADAYCCALIPALLDCRPVLIIETTGRHEIAWQEFSKKICPRAIVAVKGATHGTA